MLKGSLKSAPLSDVFQLIALSQKSGILTVERKDRHARIYFTLGKVAYAHMRSGAHLGEVLVRMDLVTALEVQEILMTQRRENPGTLLGRMAVERGILGEEDLARAIERQAFDVVGEVLTWSDGAFEFHDADPNASQVPFGSGIDALVLLMRVIQSSEEVREVSVPPEAVFSRSGDPTKVELPPGAWEVLAQLDAKSSARAIAAELDMGDQRVYHVLGRLEQLKIVERSPYLADEPLVLVVGASQALRRLIMLALQRGGLRTSTATYEDVFHRITEHHPRALLVDDDEGRAWELVRELRKDGAHGHLPVLVLVDEPPRSGLFRRLPKAEWLVKPFQELELQHEVAQLIGPRGPVGSS